MHTQNEIHVSNIMADIERETAEKLAALRNSPLPTPESPQKELMKIITESAEDFQSKTGRVLTYKEMRSMFG
jgi:hypothetical protein